MGKKRSRVDRVVFPSNLTFELLLRLPNKSLWRFLCVCKSWCNLISDHDFGKRYRALSLPNPALLTCKSVIDDTEGENLTFCVSSFDSEGTLVRQFTKRGRCYDPLVFSTCGDLLLTSSFVWNLATQEVVITLPPSYYGFALGHVPSTDEYKLLANNDNFFKVLTLGTDQWRDVDAPPCTYFVGGAFTNGAIHVVMEDHNEISSFNLEREEWGVLAAALPPLSQPFFLLHCNLRELNGYLCILDTVDKHRLDIWLLKDYDKGLWVKEYTICLSSLMVNPYWGEAEPLLIEDDGKLLLQVDSYSLQLYDPKIKSSREIQYFEEVEKSYTFHIICFSSLGHRVS